MSRTYINIPERGQKRLDQLLFRMTEQETVGSQAAA